MREIKFRAWNTRIKSMAEVERIFFNENTCEVLNGLWWDMDHIILMQYTGLKDKTGKEIYEGDIVNTKYPEMNDYLRVIIKNSDRPSLEFSPLTGFTLCKDNEEFFEIIGNIHENSELLGK